jgi:hypothetical protein
MFMMAALVLVSAALAGEHHQTKIRIAIAEGHSGDVEFIDPSGSPHGLHEVRVIKTEVTD